MVRLPQSVPVEPEDWDARPDSLLTKGHRKYLLGEKEFRGEHAAQHENTSRQRIRNRITNGLQDYEYARRLSERDKDLIFSGQSYDDPYTEGVVHCLAFLYKNITEYSAMEFDYLLDRAVRTAEMDRLAGTDYRLADIQAVIYTEYEEIIYTSEIREKLDAGENLTNEEIGRLVRAGDVKPEELEKLSSPLRIVGSQDEDEDVDSTFSEDELTMAPLVRPSGTRKEEGGEDGGDN